MVEKEVTKIVYVTVDGREYPSKRNALNHERILAQHLDPKLLALVLSEKCEAHSADGCKNCPFFNENGNCTLNVRHPWEWSSKIS